MILAGDIGGTGTRLACFEPAADGGERGLRRLRQASFRSREFGSLGEILERFLEPGEAIEAAGFGVAGPVVGDRVQTTNLPWRIDLDALRKSCGTPRVALVNDLAAMAQGILELPAERRHVLAAGPSDLQSGNLAVIAAGTGLGEALLFWDGDRHRTVSSEGGHAGFAPRGDEEIGLLRFLRAELGGHVSTERVLSGPGLHNVYRYLRQASGEPEPAWLGERLRAEDPAAVVGEVGLAERDPVCARALERFASIYGAEAGDLALRCLALSGVLVGGGIAPRILPVLQRGGFLEAFRDKGRLRGLLEAVPVTVSLDTDAPLLGAAELARRADGGAA